MKRRMSRKLMRFLCFTTFAIFPNIIDMATGHC
jgi:hypothetical protein